MNNLLVLEILFIFYIYTIGASDLFHVSSKVTFSPDAESTYFGYSVLLSQLGLKVGAPKARTREENSTVSPGLIFSCPLQKLDQAKVTCDPELYLSRSRNKLEVNKDDMWYGATMADVSGLLMVCAPRYSEIKPDNTDKLAIGACYIIVTPQKYDIVSQFKYKESFTVDGTRPEYEVEGSKVINYYKFAQGGMSVKHTENGHIIIGAPGVLDWTGVITDFVYVPRKKISLASKIEVANPYYTLILEKNVYFGYSVDSGAFDDSKTILYIGGAPRGNKGFGQVIVYDPKLTPHEHEDKESLKVKAHLVGPQFGSYFGASLCVVDLNGDGLNDLLVGAPTYNDRSATSFKNNESIPTYDQGAVFVYLNKKRNSKFHLEPAGHVGGSGNTGARFGTSIAKLGDLDLDGYNDIAIGAPWEEDGMGAVYIYKGYKYGLKNEYSQRIVSEGAKGFGMSISNGYDVDKNNCNDMAIGAHESSTAHLYRCVPTIKVMASIKVLDAKMSTGKITAQFCVTVLKHSASDVARNLKATVIIDPQQRRAKTSGKTNYVINAKSGLDDCVKHVIEVNKASDFSKPIELKFDLQPDARIDTLHQFPKNIARLSDDSVLQALTPVPLDTDCGVDMICMPWLEVTIEALSSEYVPGDVNKLGAKITVVNTKEPAYNVKLHVYLPCPPLRLPESCSFKNSDLLCKLPSPLKGNQSAELKVELEYSWEGSDKELKILAGIEDSDVSKNISGEAKLLSIPITPMSNYSFVGSAVNRTVMISREAFDRNDNIIFNHYYEVANQGPSDAFHVEVIIEIPKEVEVAGNVNLIENKVIFEILAVKAGAKAVYNVPLRFNNAFAQELDEMLKINITTIAYFYSEHDHSSNETRHATTTLILEPKSYLLLIIILSLVAGLIVLAVISFGLYKCGFFTRAKKVDNQQLIDDAEDQDEPNAEHDEPGTSQEESSTSVEIHKEADPSQPLKPISEL